MVLFTALLGTSFCLAMEEVVPFVADWGFFVRVLYSVMMINPFIAEFVERKSQGLAVACLIVMEALTGLLWVPGRLFVSSMALLVGILVFYLYKP